MYRFILLTYSSHILTLNYLNTSKAIFMRKKKHSLVYFWPQEMKLKQKSATFIYDYVLEIEEEENTMMYKQ